MPASKKLSKKFTGGRLVNISQLSEHTGVPVRTLRSLYTRRKISAIKAGHRTMFFNVDKVWAELHQLEVRAIN